VKSFVLTCSFYKLTNYDQSPVLVDVGPYGAKGRVYYKPGAEALVKEANGISPLDPEFSAFVAKKLDPLAEILGVSKDMYY
jgi:hypothetical protein